MAKRADRNPKITYPSGCKELNEELSKDELVKRLKMLARAFQDLGQDENNDFKELALYLASEYFMDHSSKDMLARAFQDLGQDENNDFKELALYLASEYFMDHSSKDVRLLVACCIADIFRVFAPEAPYTEPEHLKEIFMFLTDQLKGLKDPESPSFKRYFYLLENLAWVKSFNICLELPDNQEIFHTLFKMMFEIVSDKHSTKVVGFMLDMLCPLITEADAVSQDVLDIILFCILEPYKTQNRPAYNLAKDLIRRTASSIEPYIQTFFNNALMLGKTSESDLSDRLYDLIQELNSIASSVLLAILPQLEFKLKSSDDAERISATRLLAKLFSEPNSDLATQHKQLWFCFLGRFNDIDISIRRLTTQASLDFILNHPDLVKDTMGNTGIAEHLKQRQHDSDESVRMDVVQAIVGAAKKELRNVSDDLLECVKERTLDKKFKIRKEALIGLGQIYRRCCETSSNFDRIAWVRNKVLHAYYHSSIDDKVLVERILNTSLVPYSLDPSGRMKRLYTLYGNLDEHAVKALQEIFKTQLGLRNMLKSILDLYMRVESDELNPTIMNKIVQLSRHLPEPQKAVEQLKKFLKIVQEDMRVRGCLQKLISPDCNCKKAEEYVKEIIKKMGNPLPTNFLYTNIKQLLERVAPVMIDNQSILALVGHIDDVIKSNISGDSNDDDFEMPSPIESGMRLLLLLSNVYSVSFQMEEIYGHLMKFVKYDDDLVSDMTMQILKNVGQNLEQLYPEIHASLLPVLQKLVKIGTPKQAKHAIQCIDTMCKMKETVFKQLYEHLEKNLDLEASNFLTSLVALGHMSQLCPGLFAASSGNIVSKFVVKELLMQDRTVGRKSNENWYAEHLVSDETQAKLQSLKMIVRWLLGIRNNNNNRVGPTLRLLYSMILCEGDLMERGHINKAEMARLRLQAGCCMLRLAQEPVYADAVRLEQFETMALLVNDPCLEVRQQFVQKLHKGLVTLRLPLQYMGILSLGALDPLKDRRTLVKQMLTSNVLRRREYLKQNSSASCSTKIFSVLPDYVMPYAVHLLAHDPDFTSYDDVSALRSIKDCLVFLIDPLLLKNDTVSFTFYKKMFESIKQTKDAQCPDSEEANKKLYAICDLALNLIMSKMANFTIKDFPAEPVLPSKLYTQPDLTFSNTTVYLPTDFTTGHASKNKKAGAAGGGSKAGDGKKTNTSLQDNSSKSKSKFEIVDSPTSSSPSSPVSSTKSSPIESNERSKASFSNKLKSARVITKSQGAGGSFTAEITSSTRSRKLESSTASSKRASSIEKTSSKRQHSRNSSSSSSPTPKLAKMKSTTKAAVPTTKATVANTKTTVTTTKTTVAMPKTVTAKQKSAKANAPKSADKKMSQGKISDFVRRSSRSSQSQIVKEKDDDEEVEEEEEEEEEEKEESDSEVESSAPSSLRSGKGRKQSSQKQDKPVPPAATRSSRSSATTSASSTPKTNKQDKGSPKKTNTRTAPKKVVQEDDESGEDSNDGDDPNEEKEKNVRLSTRNKGKTTPEESAKPAKKASPKKSVAKAQSDDDDDDDEEEESEEEERSTRSNASRKRKLDSSQGSSQSTSAKKSKSLNHLNGGSDGDDSPSAASKKSRSSTPLSAVLMRRKGILAVKRREGAAAKAAQKYADFEVVVKSPVKKR